VYVVKKTKTIMDTTKTNAKPEALKRTKRKQNDPKK
jgi:hypothetical protein